MKFSIIVAAYNVAEYLEECVESLVSQNFPDSEYEVLIVDDGSTVLVKLYRMFFKDYFNRRNVWILPGNHCF